MSVAQDVLGLKPKKKKINSKRKGNTNELRVAKLLSQWMGIEFQRTPQSGGRRWKNNDMIIGDLVCTDRKIHFKYAIETKHLGHCSFNSARFREAWAQTVRDAIRSKKKPFFILRTNGMPVTEFYFIFKHEDRPYTKDFDRSIYVPIYDDLVYVYSTVLTRLDFELFRSFFIA